MKIPASSSLILATLAISSSSASLAAPTGEVPSMTGSSLHRPHAGQAMDNEERADTHMMERDSGDGTLEEQNLSLSGMMSELPVLGPLLAPALAQLLATDCRDASNAQAAEADPAALQRLQDAVGTVSSALSGLLPTGAPIAGLPLPIPVPSGLPVPAEPLPIIGAQGVDDDSDPNSQNRDPNDSAIPSATPSSDASLNGGDHSSFPSHDAAPTGDAAAAGESRSSGGSFLISPTTTIANAAEATPAPQDPDYLSTGGAGTPTSPGVPSGPPNTPVPASSAPASD